AKKTLLAQTKAAFMHQKQERNIYLGQWPPKFCSDVPEGDRFLLAVLKTFAFFPIRVSDEYLISKNNQILHQ
ncbi:MAG: hypothetical protein V1862_13395, partial [Methanobacteriota archaeon]